MQRVWILGLMVAGCGGSCPEAGTAAASESAPNAPVVKSASAEPEPANETSDGPPGATAPAEKDSPAQSGSETASAPVTNPEFPENATVAQAVAAIPKGTQRANIDPETLGEPLQSESVYAPCKVGTQHFKLRVAVWNGRAVGVDVTTTSKALADCIDKQVRNVTWHSAVRSLNTVEYSM